MHRKILLSGIAMLLLCGFVRAADEDQPVPPQAPPDVLFFKVAPGQPLPMQSEDDSVRQLRVFEQAVGGRQHQALIGEAMPAQMQGVMRVRLPGGYWLGIECYSVPTVLRVHLSLPENQGLVVASVIPESPAAKAGLEVNDILMQVGEKRLSTVQDLSETIESAMETPLEMETIHAGKAKTVEITPAKRPQNMIFKQEGTPADWNEIEQWMQKMQSGAAVNQPQRLRFRVIQPGAILPPGAPVQPPMPGNMSININRNGNEPAKITVTWNGKKFEATEKKLDELPAEVRPFVERMLGQGKIEVAGPNGMVSAEALNFTIPAPASGMPGAPGPQMQVQPFRSLEDRLEELSRKIDQLQKELHGQHDEHHPPTHVERDNPENEPAK